MTAPLDLDALEALRVDATPGPWTHEDNELWAMGDCDTHPITAEAFHEGSPFFNRTCRTRYEVDANFDLIVAAVNALPALIAELRSARQDAERLLLVLLVILDNVDYTAGACSVTEMVGAVLPEVTIKNARSAIDAARGEKP